MKCLCICIFVFVYKSFLLSVDCNQRNHHLATNMIAIVQLSLGAYEDQTRF